MPMMRNSTRRRKEGSGKAIFSKFVEKSNNIAYKEHIYECRKTDIMPVKKKVDEKDNKIKYQIKSPVAETETYFSKQTHV